MFRFKVKSAEMSKIEKSDSESITEDTISSGYQHGSLLQHKEVMEDEKSYKCYHCMSQFINKAYLSMHEQSVHGGCQYPCCSSDSQANTRDTARTHQKSFHGGPTFQCDLCDVQFSQKSSIAKHKL